jgi:hypothetical protein
LIDKPQIDCEGYCYQPCSPDVVIEDVVQGVNINERQSIILPDATGGNWVLSWRHDGSTQSVTIPYRATAAQVRNRFGSMSNVGGRQNLIVTGSGTSADPYTIEFVNDLAGNNLRTVRVDISQLVGTSNSYVARFIDGTINEQVTITNTAGTDESFVVSFGGANSIEISSSASLNALQSALESMSSIGAGNISVTGLISNRDVAYRGPWILQFIGEYAGQNVGPVSIQQAGATLTSPYVVNTNWNGGPNGGANEVQRIVISSKEGFFKLTLTSPDSTPIINTTGNIAFNASANEIKQAIVSSVPWLSASDINIVLVSRNLLQGLYSYNLEFTGAYSRRDMPLVRLDSSNLSGGTAIVRVLQEGYGIRDQQLLTVYRASSGTYRLRITVRGVSYNTSNIPWDVTVDGLKNIIESLPPFATGDVIVTKQLRSERDQNYRYLIGFRRKFGDIPTIIPNFTNLKCDPARLPRVSPGPYNYDIPLCSKLSDFNSWSICDYGEPTPPTDTTACCDAENMPELVNRYTLLQLERDLFDPNEHRTIKYITTLKGLSTSEYVPYVRDGVDLIETSYDTVVASKMRIVLIPNDLNTENGINRIMLKITNNEILPSRYV